MSSIPFSFYLNGLILLGWSVGWIPFLKKRTLPKRLREEPQAQVSLVIPARNEEKNLPLLLSTLLESVGSHWLCEVIVVDDASEDRTAEIAKNWGARVIQAKPLEMGWTGKTWACHQGAEASHGNVLVFLDSDTRFESGGLKKWVEQFAAFSSPVALSLLPDFICEDFYENFSAFFFLAMAWGTRAWGGGDFRDHRLVGQCLMIRKEDYLRAGGHQGVKGEILENLWMSLVLQKIRVEPISLLGRGMIQVRMFPEGIWQLIAGWKKSFAKGSTAISKAALFESALWMTAAISSALELVFDSSWINFFIYLLFSIQIFFLLKKIGKFSPWTSVLFPVFLFFYQALFFHSLLNQCFGRSAEWKGRKIPVTPPSQGKDS